MGAKAGTINNITELYFDDSIFKGPNGDEYKIISFTGKTLGPKDPEIVIQFINTLNVQHVSMYYATQLYQCIDYKKYNFPNMHDKLRENTKGEKYIILDSYKTELSNETRFLIAFIDTFRIFDINYKSVKYNTVSNPYAITVRGVASFGKPKRRHTRHEVVIWDRMIGRCYNQNDTNYKIYGAQGVKVCGRWLCFENFLDDIQFIENYDKMMLNPNNWHLDKDKLQFHLPMNKRVYSFETCIFIPRADNARLAVKSRMLNQGKEKTSVYNGVIRRNNVSDDVYEANIGYFGKQRVLGTFDDELAAAICRDRYDWLYNSKDLSKLFPKVPYDYVYTHRKTPKHYSKYFIYKNENYDNPPQNIYKQIGIPKDKEYRSPLIKTFDHEPEFKIFKNLKGL